MIVVSKSEEIPVELADLLQLVRGLPAESREDLEGRVLDAIEHARFRARAMSLARTGLEQMRLELAMTRFDLDQTRSERNTLRRQDY